MYSNIPRALFLTIKHFVEWTNQYLKRTGDQITNLVTDFQDGVKLIRLVEALTGKKVARYNRNPRFRSQKIDNINVAITTLEKEWGLSAVGVDPVGMVHNFVHRV